MPLSIAIRFPTGRFHATPWGHHVNEGLPEWPPSPWRLLRALVATWKRKLPDEPLIERELPTVLADLAREPPEFFLPPATLGHTRHYMPWFKKGPEDKTLVFDAFVSLALDADIVFHWPNASFSAEGQQALNAILSQLGYFGRAESWCGARVLQDFDAARVNCRPGSAQAGEEPVRVLVPDPHKWNGWDFTDKRIVKPTPPWNLLAETADMHQERWSDPPGATWINYARRSDCFAVQPRSQRPSTVRPSGFTLARFALDGTVLPLVADTLPVAEAARLELLRRCRAVLRRQGIDADRTLLAERYPAIVGKTPDGRPMCGHQHAFYLPADEDGDGRLDHLTLFAPMGFNALECHALQRLRRLPLGEGDPLPLLLIGLAHPKDFRSPLFAESKVWVSATPFVVTRYPKVRGTKRDRPEDYASPRDFARHVLLQELDRRAELPQVESIEEEGAIGVQRLRPIQFRRFRRKHGDDGGRRPAGCFRISFASSVRGPLCLGHSCHFGLGLFVPPSASTANRDS